MVKKSIFFISLLLSTLFSPSVLFAQEKAFQNPGVDEATQKMIIRPEIYPVPNSLPKIFGQHHAYSVTFRGNGEAIVTVRIALTNTGSYPLTSLSLRVPRVDPMDIEAYQVIREPQCIRYGGGLNPPPNYNLELPANSLQRCLEFQEPDYFQYWGDTKYQKASVQKDGDTLTVNLPSSIKTNASGSYVLFYRAFGYTKRNLVGAFNATFETLKINDRIAELTVGITPDQDLFMRGFRGKVSYRLEEPQMALKGMAMESAPARSAQFDSFLQQIGTGSITKKATNLQPLDGYSVKTSYADSYGKLYAKEITIGIFAVFLIFVIVFLIIRWVMKLFVKPNSHSESESVKKENSMQSSKSSFQSLDVLIVVGISFVSSLCIAGYTMGLRIMTSVLENYFSMDITLPILLFVAIISLGVYGFFLIVPPLLIGIKRGLGKGIITFLLTLFWIFFYLVVAVFIMIVMQPNYRYRPIQIMEKMMGVTSTDNLPNTNVERIDLQ